MTTIVYKDGVIAYDSRCTRSGIIESDNTEKKVIINGIVYFGCGTLTDAERFAEYYEKREASGKVNFEALVIDSGIVYDSSVCDDEGFWRNEIDEPFAIGSGKMFAFTAMDMGASAKEAVEMAIKRDMYSGGKVRTFKMIKTPKPDRS